MLPLAVGRCPSNAQGVAVCHVAGWALLGIMVLSPRTHIAAAEKSMCELSRSVLQAYGVETAMSCAAPNATTLPPRHRPGQPSCRLLEQNCALEGSGFHRELTCQVAVTCSQPGVEAHDRGEALQGGSAQGLCDWPRNSGSAEHGCVGPVQKASCGAEGGGRGAPLDPTLDFAAGNSSTGGEGCMTGVGVLPADCSGGDSPGGRGACDRMVEKAGGCAPSAGWNERHEWKECIEWNDCNECSAPVEPGAVGGKDGGLPQGQASTDGGRRAEHATGGWVSRLGRWWGAVGLVLGRAPAAPNQARGDACAVCGTWRLSVLQPLPAGVYADPWELARWERDRLRNPDHVHSFRVFGPIDVESVEALAAPTLLVAETLLVLKSSRVDPFSNSSAAMAHPLRGSGDVSPSCEEQFDGRKLCGVGADVACTHVGQGIPAEAPRGLPAPSQDTTAGPKWAGVKTPGMRLESTVRVPLHQRYPKPHGGPAGEAGAGLLEWMSGAETTFHLPAPYVLLGTQGDRARGSGVTWAHVGPGVSKQPASSQTHMPAMRWMLLTGEGGGPAGQREEARGLDWHAPAGKLQHGLLVGPITLLFQLACAYAALRAVYRSSQGQGGEAGAGEGGIMEERSSGSGERRMVT